MFSPSSNPKSKPANSHNLSKMNDLLNILIALLQKNDHKLAIETLKASIDHNGMSKEYNDVFKSYIDLGYALFEEKDYEKSKIECTKLINLLQSYKNN